MSARFWSKSLKELVSVRKVHIVMDGMTFGIVTFHSVCHELAPSMRAASEDILRHGLETCNVDYHHVAYLLPRHRYLRSPRSRTPS